MEQINKLRKIFLFLWSILASFHSGQLNLTENVMITQAVCQIRLPVDPHEDILKDQFWWYLAILLVLVLCARVFRYLSLSFPPPLQYHGGEWNFVCGGQCIENLKKLNSNLFFQDQCPCCWGKFTEHTKKNRFHQDYFFSANTSCQQRGLSIILSNWNSVSGNKYYSWAFKMDFFFNSVSDKNKIPFTSIVMVWSDISQRWLFQNQDKKAKLFAWLFTGCN